MSPKDNTSLYGIGVLGAAAVGLGAYFLLKGEGGITPPPSKYYCPCCDAWFTSPEALQAHLATIHPNGCQGADDEVLRVLNDALDLVQETLSIENLQLIVEKTAAVTSACYTYSEIYADYQMYPSDEALAALNEAGASIVRTLNALSGAWIADINQAKDAAIAQSDNLVVAHDEWIELNQLISYLETFTGGVLILYQDKNYDGARVSFYPPGQYPDLSDSSTDIYAVAGFSPIRKNQASSMRLSAHFKVKFFSNDNFHMLYTTDHAIILHGGEGGLELPNLDAIPFDLLNPDDYYANWEDNVESMIVEPDTEALVTQEYTLRVSLLPQLRNTALDSVAIFDSRVRDASLLALITGIASLNIEGFNFAIPGLAENQTLADGIQNLVEGMTDFYY